MVRKVEKDKTCESVLVRQSYREGPRVKKRTLASLTALPAAAIEAIERTLRGETLVPASEALTISRSWPHGTEDELYAAMGWLLERQQSIEKGLARRNLTPDGVVLYDLTSTYVEGEHCPLAKRGYSRDGNPGKQQIEFGLLTNGDGVPVEAFAGSTGDPSTFQGQVQKVRDRFGVREVVWEADRGMLTSAPLRDGATEAPDPTHRGRVPGA